jgi:hypothetical protein
MGEDGRRRVLNHSVGTESLKDRFGDSGLSLRSEIWLRPMQDEVKG